MLYTHALPRYPIGRTQTLYSGEPIDTLTNNQILELLSIFSPEETRSMRRLWREYAKRKEMIGRRYGVYYELDENLNYFRISKGIRRRVPYSSIKLDYARFAKGIQQRQRALTTRFLAGRMDPQEWYDETVRMMRLSYRAALETVNPLKLTADEKARWVRMAAQEFQAFNRTVDRIMSGKKPFSKSLLLTADRISSAIVGMTENLRREMALRAGFTQGRRRLTNSEHCKSRADLPGCVELARKGWQPLFQVLPIGQAACFWHCNCIIEYR